MSRTRCAVGPVAAEQLGPARLEREQLGRRHAAAIRRVPRAGAQSLEIADATLLLLAADLRARQLGAELVQLARRSPSCCPACAPICACGAPVAAPSDAGELLLEDLALLA